MARMARAVAPGIPHHVTQRGNRRQQTFFMDDDYRAYQDLMSTWCGKYRVDIWAYCLMPNHVHLIAVPENQEGLNLAIGEAHRRYTRHINFREGWRGHLWQGRFGSFIMDETYLLACAKYIELNPVRAGLVKNAVEWPWSSARAHVQGKNDTLVNTAPLCRIIRSDWEHFLKTDISDSEIEEFRKYERTGRPLGKNSFIKQIEAILGRRLRPRKPGPKKQDK